MAELRARRVYDDEDRTVVVVESIDIRFRKADEGFGFLARSEPVAVVVATADGTHAVDVNAEPLDVVRLIDEVPELGDLVAS
jgi:hypothetical protein